MTTLTQPRQTVSAPGKLINLIIKRLLPMLIEATDGDARAARALAAETVNDYAPRNNADLLAIAQIIACGVTALGNLSVAMAGNLPLIAVLRLQAAANALERTAEQNRRFLRQTPPPPPPDSWYEHSAEENAALEAAALEAVAEAQRHIAQTRAEQARTDQTRTEQTRTDQARPEPARTDQARTEQTCAEAEKPPAEPAPPRTPTPPAPTPARDLTEQEKAILWAQSMNRVAAEYTASIPNLPPEQRQQASLRAAALSTTANALIAGVPPDPFLLPKTPKTPNPPKTRKTG